MRQNLLAIADLEPPMGDLFTNIRLDAGRAVWASPAPGAGEKNSPKRSIMHQRVLRLHGDARLFRLGVRRGQGYHKCGSNDQDPDWVAGFRVLAWQRGVWRMLIEKDNLKPDASGEVRWFAFPRGCVASGVIIETRKSGIDGGWTPWNLAMSAFVLEGELIAPVAPRLERTLRNGGVDLAKLPRGVRAAHRDGEVRYVTKDFEVGFRLNRPGFSYLGLHMEDVANRGKNILTTRPPLFCHGPHYHPVGVAPVISSVLRCDIDGKVRVRGNTVTYDFTAGAQTYRLVWTVTTDGLRLRATRNAKKVVQAWNSSAWQIGINTAVTPSHVLGRLLEDGETGAVALPALLVLPAFGAWEITSTARKSSEVGAAWARSDCYRNQNVNTLDLNVGEQRTSEGLYVLPAGRHTAVFEMRPKTPPSLLQASAPAVARRALARTQWTSLTFRADSATLSNNGASMPCAISMETWSAVATRTGDVLPGLPATEFLRYSLERWLTGGPSYASGRLFRKGVIHDTGDEYLMTGAAALRGLGDYLAQVATPTWFREHRTLILQRINNSRKRDLDGDGLIESPYRTGVSGTGQWSTCWYDVISFGWKDAFSNAILLSALVQLAAGLRRFGEAAESANLDEWAARLRASYRDTFWNEKTGWFAGWRCREGKLHDYAFLPVNGAAVTSGLVGREEARALLRRLLDEMKRVNMPDASLGLPCNLRVIPDADLTDIMHGYPLGYYQNGGRTHSQTRHFVMALYEVGLTREADALLLRLCVGFAEARVFGGNQTGVDWRYWDDRPCGYEGLLTDQFGILEAVLTRWGKTH